MTAVATDLLLDDDDWDLVLEDGDLVVNSGHDAVRQALYKRLRFFAGEWFADENIGIPYWDDVLVKKPNLPAIREIFRQQISATPGVASVDSISLAQSSGRNYALSFVVTMDDGTLLESDSFQVGAP
jgi:hypothetical protein